MKRKGRAAIIIAVLSLILAGCSVKAGTSQPNVNENTNLGDEMNAEEEQQGEKLEEKSKEQIAQEEKEQAERKQAELLKEREELERQRKEQAGEFYVPLPPLGEEAEVRTVKAKALYVTANVAGFHFDENDVAYYAEYIRSISGKSASPADAGRMDEINKLEKALAICSATEINALVIDIKNDDGLVAWNSDIEAVNRIKSNGAAPLNNYSTLMDYLKKNDIYCIARVVAFKDPYFAKTEPGHSIQLKSGGVYTDKAGTAWVNPFDEYVWKYVIAISKEAALRGFDEIQFDYVRFPDGAKYYNPITEFPGRNDRSKDEGIEAFLQFANEELGPYHVNLAADVFGFITRSWDDTPEDIGQTWRKIANQTDYICPMIYPSHYGTGLYGYQVPDQHPYEISRLALMEAIERNAAQKEPGIIRPWFQGFTAPWIKGHIEYDAKAVSDQMVAGMELGIDEYIIWSASNNYDPMSFFYQDRISTSIRSSEEDILARTPEAALKRYLDAEKSGRYSHIYLLTPIAERPDDYDQFASETAQTSLILKGYEILGIEKYGDGEYMAAVNGEYSSNSGTAVMQEAKFRIVLENDVFKVIKPELEWENE